MDGPNVITKFPSNLNEERRDLELRSARLY